MTLPCSGGPPPHSGRLFKTYLKLSISFILTEYLAELSYCTGFRKMLKAQSQKLSITNLRSTVIIISLCQAFFQVLVLLCAAHTLRLLIALHRICHHRTMFHRICHHLIMSLRHHRTIFHCNHRTMFH